MIEDALELWDDALSWARAHLRLLRNIALFAALSTLVAVAVYDKLMTPPIHVGADLDEARSVVLLLHGHGASRDDLVPLAEELFERLPDVAFLTLQAPHRTRGGFTWYPAFRVPKKEDVPAKLAEYQAEARLIVADALRELAADGVPSERVVLAGFSQGATLAVDTFMNEPTAQDVAGVVSLSGGALTLDYQALKVRAPPRFLVTHGTKDRVLGPTGSRSIVETLKSGGHQVQFIEFDGGHRIAPEVRAALAEFLKE